ncbi:MAG: exonuclease domain-containing protein [Pseudomonadota bacterium]|nr:exonuclease domain-containing protein [Pseudomonadota bacterium]
MALSWLFYDVESSDLNKVFGQIVQFAAIRVDEDFDEIECHEFLVRLNRDTLPSPDAVLVHRLLPENLYKGKTEYDALKAIHNLVNQPGTMNGGYNTLGYDDDVLRFGFYRNFLTPYTHGFANGCKRFDLFPMLLYYYYDGFEEIKWPVIDGKVSLKLENLNQLNGWVDGIAHDALVDVKVCVALAKAMSKDQMRWSNVFKYLYARDFKAGSSAIYLSALIGSKDNFAAPVTYIGQNKAIKNTTYWLRLNVSSFKEVGLQEADVLRKKIPDTALIVPENKEYFEADLVQSNLAWIKQNKHAWQIFVEQVTGQILAPVENIDVDAALYQNAFFNDDELNFMTKLHDTSPEHWLELDGCSKRLYPMVVKWLWRHNWDCLDADTISMAVGLGLTPGSDFQGKAKTTYTERLQRIDELIKINEKNSENTKMLYKLKSYYINCLSIF